MPDDWEKEAADFESPWADADWQKYADHARNEVRPMIEASMIGMSFFDGRDIDPRMACELGYLVMLDKPIIAIVEPGAKMPDKLVRVCDEIVEAGDVRDPVFAKRMNDAVARVQAKLEEN